MFSGKSFHGESNDVSLTKLEVTRVVIILHSGNIFFSCTFLIYIPILFENVIICCFGMHQVEVSFVHIVIKHRLYS